MPERKEQRVFIRDPEFAWVPATKLDNNDKFATVNVPQYRDEQSIVCDGGKAATGWEEDEVPLSEYNKGVLPMQNVNAQGELRAFPDMVNLPFLHEVSVTCRHCIVWMGQSSILAKYLIRFVFSGRLVSSTT